MLFKSMPMLMEGTLHFKRINKYPNSKKMNRNIACSQIIAEFITCKYARTISLWLNQAVCLSLLVCSCVEIKSFPPRRYYRILRVGSGQLHFLTIGNTRSQIFRAEQFITLDGRPPTPGQLLELTPAQKEKNMNLQIIVCVLRAK